MSDAIGKLEDIRRIIESKRNQLESLSRSIWNQPEFSFSEKFAHDAITDYLENNGFVVERNFVVATGFRATAEISGGEEGSVKGLTAGFVCDYDALPQMGHTSGHNLRTYCSVAAAVGLKQFLSENHNKGNVVVLGTPGEDCGCGTKIQMLRKGVFAGIDFCMMPTPLTYNILFPKHYSLAVLSVTYRGKASHASAYPWEGRNALDAAVACYNNIALNRQQMKPTTNINGIISEGGTQPNVVPHRSSLKFWLRAPDIAELMMLQARCNACVLSAAKATGCEVQFEFQDDQYQPMEHNQPMGFVYKRHAEAMGITCTEDRSILQTHIGSTDFGNVSHTLPCIAPAYNIGTKAVLHSEGFHLASGSVDAHGQTFRVAVALGQTAAEIMTTPKLWQEIKSSHEASCKLPLPSAAIIAERGRSASVSAVI